MSLENGKHLLKSDSASMHFEETELTLGMPGETRGLLESRGKSGTKRVFSETINLNLGRSTATYGNKDDESAIDVSSAVKPPSKTQVVGWPPVRAYRKNAMNGGKFVKVAVDGAPYLRKVDLEVYESYQQLLDTLEHMFSCFTIRNYLKEGKIMDQVNGGEYEPTYEDKDGDWMMVGDVPWKMFVESCKRLRLMKSSEAIGLAPKTPSKCSSSS